MAEIITFCNQKGGVGKTTTSFNIARAFSLKKKNVLVIDLDEQANLTEALIAEDSKQYEVSIADSLISQPVNTLFSVMTETIWENVMLLPSAKGKTSALLSEMSGQGAIASEFRQMVYLHCVERGGQMIRVTNDLDALLNVRAKSDALYDFTKRLTDIGFDSVGVSPEGYEHRWIKDKVQIDILIPDHLGEQAQSKLSVHGFKTIATPGAQQALDRTEKIRFYRMGFRE